ncbi:hypothetical protein P7C73_g6326, partial [Tremellales sp. Uapishka_1]
MSTPDRTIRTHSHSRTHASSSSYSTLLITALPTSDTSPNHPISAPRLRYPYPLPLLALLDLAYTVHHAWIHQTPAYFLVLCAIRSVVSGGIVGCSKRWRSRGGWIGLCSVLTLGIEVWEGCSGLLKGEEMPRLHAVFLINVGAPFLNVHIKRKLSHHRRPASPFSTTYVPIDSLFLVLPPLITQSLQLIFLLLLRLSPPTHRSHPFSLRLPRSAIQAPSSFSYQTADPRLPSSASLGVADEEQGFFTDPEDEGGFTSEDNDPEDEDDESSVSESSIIDLPLPPTPSRIDGDSLLRRSRSARMLGRSWGSHRSDVEEREEYGTFGGRAQHHHLAAEEQNE